MKKINKPTARKLYNSGADVVMIPCKCRPGGAWLTGATVNKNSTSRSFDDLVNEFVYYNCNYYELGYYPAFYIEEV
jgi:hypothetical protein